MIYLKAALLAVVEGITEFLPISSTGHMILVDEWIKLSADQAFADAFMVIIQLPAILAVVVYFRERLWPFVSETAERNARIVLWTKIGVAFAPAVVFGLLLDDFIEEKLFNGTVVALALLAGGVLLILLERGERKSKFDTVGQLTYQTAILIGLCQCLAMIPGTSRSAATIIGAMAFGMSRVAAAEFSFFLAIPTMLGATAFTVLKHGLAFNAQQWLVLACGSAISFAVAYGVVAWLMHFIRRHDFRVFGYYRIALGVAVLAYFALAR